MAAEPEAPEEPSLALLLLLELFEFELVSLALLGAAPEGLAGPALLPVGVVVEGDAGCGASEAGESGSVMAIGLIDRVKGKG